MSFMGIVVGFVFISVVLLIGLIFSRLHWLIKAAMISVSPLISWLFYVGLLGQLGYPAQSPMPPRFRFLSSFTREPTLDDTGAIFIWIMRPNQPPRALVLPYSKMLRDEMVEAKKRVASGQAVYMGSRAQTSQPSGSAAGRSAGMTGSGHGTSSAASSSSGNGNGALDFLQPEDTVPKKATD